MAHSALEVTLLLAAGLGGPVPSVTAAVVKVPVRVGRHMYTHTHTHHIFFIHSPVDRHLGCFHVLAILNSAAINIGVHVSFQIRVFIFS